MKQRDEFGPAEEWNDSEESFEELERYLSQAMRRVDAPEGFADRVMARAKAAPPAKVLMMPSRVRLWLGSAVAAALLLGAYVGDEVHQRHQRERSLAVQTQFEAGMQITDRALEHTREQLQRAGVTVGK